MNPESLPLLPALIVAGILWLVVIIGALVTWHRKLEAEDTTPRYRRATGLDIDGHEGVE